MKTFLTTCKIFLLCGVLVLPVVVLAQERPTGGGAVLPGGGGVVSPLGGGTFTPTGGGACGGQGNVFVLCNPLTVNNFCDLIRALLNILLIIGTPVATLFLVFAGFKFVFARGNPTELETARRNFKYVIIGIAIFLGAWTIATVLAATMQALSPTLKICGVGSGSNGFTNSR